MKLRDSVIVLVSIVVLLIITMFFSLSVMNRLKNNLNLQVHTDRVINALNGNLISLLNIETGERGYLISGDTTFLQPYKLGTERINDNSKMLRELTKDNSSQQKNLDTLEMLTKAKLQRVDAMLALKKTGNEKKIEEMLALTDEGRMIMDRIRETNKNMQIEEHDILEKRTAATKKSIYNLQRIVTIEGVISFLLTLILALGIIREVNRRTKLEKELAVSNERFFKIFDKNPIAMTFGETGTNKLVFANKAFYKSFGYSKEEVIGHTSEELKLISPEENARLFPILLGYLNETRSVEELRALPRQESEKLLVKLKQAMGDRTLEVLYTRKNGETFYALVSYDLIEIGGKNYAITSYQDIDEQKSAENKIIVYSKELERKNKEIEQFAYVSSHDLQEPLRTIANFSQLLSQKVETYADNEAREYMNYINKGAKRMSNLIFDLLEYSRVGKNLVKARIDCNAMVKEILDDMSGSIKESGAQISVGKLPIVTGFVYLKSLFQNLLSNAIKYRKAGTQPVISVSATDTGKEYQFSVKDNGIGIEKEYYGKIFLIFQRLHTRGEYEGTGIGLSLSKKIVELHGGRIWVESEPEKGSTFYFTIPKN